VFFLIKVLLLRVWLPLQDFLGDSQAFWPPRALPGPPQVRASPPTGSSPILHDCFKARASYDERTAWAHHNQDQQNCRLTAKTMECLTRRPLVRGSTAMSIWERLNPRATVGVGP
jgi:hypothetical protein